MVTIPPNISPSSPVTWEMIAQFLETQAQANVTGPFLGWAFNPVHASGTAILGTAGSVYGSAITLAAPASIGNLWYDVTTAGATLTSGDCWALLFGPGGVLIGQSASQHTIWATAGLGGTAAGGTALVAATTGSLTSCPAGVYYGAVVATGSTLPTFATSGAPPAVYNANMGAAASKCAILATAVTTTPASVTPSSYAQAGSLPIWMALS